ncbi:hypothetical protein C1645_841356 [Glomus cerebriforme]|uniref:Uncharacterized protein n=1 Tax=Glomus cerebriforme TaxID=658196 RepID=A0A397S8X4_9GLOM|nr:hypothetical protein C1645_841356 [Glomus cerebriforme]
MEDNNEQDITKSSPLYTLLEEIKIDYQTGDSQLRAALIKFAERYRAEKSKSIPQLCSLLHDLNHGVDQTTRVRLFLAEKEGFSQR